jgi:hypothetical protein
MWLEVVRQIWKDKWEVILALVGIAATFWEPIRSFVWGAVGFLLVIDLAGKVNHEIRLSRARHVPLVVFVPSPRKHGAELDAYTAMLEDVSQSMRRVKFDEGELINRFGVARDEWSLWRDTLLPVEPPEWQRTVQRFDLRVQRMNYKLGQQRVFHVFLQCPAALAMGLGATLETQHQFTVYHYQPPYNVVFSTSGMDESLRVRLGRKVGPPYHYIAVSPPGEITPDTYVSVFAARHDPRMAWEETAHAAKSAVLHVDWANPELVALTAEDDWLLVAQEIAAVVLGLTGRGAKRIHMALSCPVALAFLIGVALGAHSTVTVYNWFKSQGAYYPVLALDRLAHIV